MTERTTAFIYPFSGAVLVAALAVFNWYLAPEHGFKWAVAGLLLPLGWGGYELLLQGRPIVQRVRGSAVLAASLLTVVLSFAAADTAGVLGAGGDEATTRAFGVMMGFVLVVLGNAMPKQLEPMLERATDPARAQSFRRFAGWTFVLAGLGHAAAWVVLPVGPANTVAMTLVASAVGLLGIRWAIITKARQ